MKCFDFEGFYRRLNVMRLMEKMPWVHVAKESGVSQSTLTRLGQGKPISVNNIVRLSDWASLKLDRFVIDEVSGE